MTHFGGLGEFVWPALFWFGLVWFGLVCFFVWLGPEQLLSGRVTNGIFIL